MYRILNNVPGKSSCDYYRNHLPCVRMRSELLDHGIQMDSVITMDSALDYDCYIFPRIPGNPEMFLLIDRLFREGKRIIWDLDDELWNVPESNPASKVFTKNHAMWLSYYFPRSTRIISSTNNLAKSITNTWNVNPDKVVVLENLIEREVYDKLHTENKSGLFKILWSGSDSHEDDLEPVDALFQYYADNYHIHFIFYGHMPERFKMLHPNNLTVIPWTNRKYYEGILCLLNVDIALVPLADNQFNRCKSAIKYYEMAMAGACPIVSNVEPYSDVIENEKNGILLSNPGDWPYACDQLMKLNSIKSVAKKARDNVLNNFSWDTDNKRRRDWLTFFKSIPELEVLHE